MARATRYCAHLLGALLQGVRDGRSFCDVESSRGGNGDLDSGWRCPMVCDGRIAAGLCPVCAAPDCPVEGPVGACPLFPEQPRLRASFGPVRWPSAEHCGCLRDVPSCDCLRRREQPCSSCSTRGFGVIRGSGLGGTRRSPAAGLRAWRWPCTTASARCVCRLLACIVCAEHSQSPACVHTQLHLLLPSRVISRGSGW